MRADAARPAADLARLRRERPRRRFVRGSVVVLAVIMAFSWIAGDFGPAEWATGNRVRNLERFLGELRPWPLQQPDAPAGLADRLALGGAWAGRMWRDQGADAVRTTLAVSLVAILLAGAAGVVLGAGAARNLASPQPFLADGRPPAAGARRRWRAVVAATRMVLALLRSLPEYVLAFLLLGLLGPSPWPMILALALHNAGILGKLTADVVENVDTRAPAALRGAGAGRWTTTAFAVVPLTLPRFLLFAFYRWETCVRESTVLGMLGMVSLGFGIVDARSRNAYDEMFFFILCGMGLVLAGDLVSALVRRAVRRA